MSLHSHTEWPANCNVPHTCLYLPCVQPQEQWEAAAVQGQGSQQGCVQQDLWDTSLSCSEGELEGANLSSSGSTAQVGCCTVMRLCSAKRDFPVQSCAPAPVRSSVLCPSRRYLSRVPGQRLWQNETLPQHTGPAAQFQFIFAILSATRSLCRSPCGLCRICSVGMGLLCLGMGLLCQTGTSIPSKPLVLWRAVAHCKPFYEASFIRAVDRAGNNQLVLRLWPQFRVSSCSLKYLMTRCRLQGKKGVCFQFLR